MTPIIWACRQKNPHDKPQQGHRPPNNERQLRSLYVFLNRQDHGELPLRHEGKPSTATATPARLSALSDHIPVVAQHGHNDLAQELHQECEEICGNLSLLHNRNVHHSVEELNLRHEELEELLELVAEEHRDVQNEEEEPSGSFSSSSFSSSSSSRLRKRRSRTRPHALRQREARRHGPWRGAVRPTAAPSSASFSKAFFVSSVREEELEGGVVDGFACLAGQQRHGQRRRRGSHVTDRDCPTPRLRLRLETRPLPREWRLLCPETFVLLVLHSLPGSGPRLAP